MTTDQAREFHAERAAMARRQADLADRGHLVTDAGYPGLSARQLAQALRDEAAEHEWFASEEAHRPATAAGTLSPH